MQGFQGVGDVFIKNRNGKIEKNMKTYDGSEFQILFCNVGVHLYLCKVLCAIGTLSCPKFIHLDCHARPIAL